MHVIAKKKSVYSPHPGFAMKASFMTKLTKKTGKTLEEWIAILKKSGPPTEKERRAWLKENHGFTTNYAWFVAECAEGRGTLEQYDPEGMVDTMFSGAKTPLRPIYEQLL